MWEIEEKEMKKRNFSWRHMYQQLQNLSERWEKDIEIVQYVSVYVSFCININFTIIENG